MGLLQKLSGIPCIPHVHWGEAMPALSISAQALRVR